MDSDYFTQSQFTGTLVSRSGQAGTVVKIQMKNFMCHDNLEVKLNPRINFICGKNGSGKSAIQTAIAVGLGGKALATNRGSSIKALIKNDKNSCTIIIVISNEGALSYNPQDYGQLIQVERTFSHTSQGYKLKNYTTGKLVSTEKKELDKIVAQFNIQTDNPVCILHQDVARNFLNSSDPKNKFKFFLKASRFDEISKLYSESTIRVLSIRESIDGKFQVLQEAFKDVIEMRKKLKTLEDAKDKEKHRENLENELIWAKIQERNLDLQGLHKKRDIEAVSRKNMERKLIEGEENNLKEKLRELEEKISEMNDLAKDAKEKVKPARDDFSRKKERLANVAREVQEAKQSARRTKSKYESCLAEIENLTRNAPEIKLRQEKLKKKIVECETNLESIKAAERSFEHDRQQLRDTIDNVNGTLQTLGNRYRDLERQKSKREDQLKQMTSNTSNLTVYGKVMAAIVDDINKAAAQRRFEKKPVGPIGMHIKVRDSSWAGAVENFLNKGFLSSFCVDNQRDLTVLSNIIKAICSRQNATQPAIICSKFFPKMHNIAQSETGTQQYTNLVRALDIDNPVVANCLIDQMEVESVLLIPTNKEAYQLLDEQHKVPRKCKRAFTKTGDLFIPAPNYKSYSNPKPITNAILLQANQEDIIRDLKNEINQISREMSEVDGERQNLKRQERATMESLRKNEEELKNLKRQRYNIEQQVKELQASIEPEGETNVGFFEEEKRVLQQQQEEEVNRFERLKTDYEKLKAEAEEAKTVFEQLQSTIEESDREKAPIQGEIQRLKSAIQQASSKADLMKQKIKEHDKKLNQIETQINELTEQLTQNTENASQICAPVTTERGVEEINRELKAVVLYLKRLEEENGGSLAELQKDFNERQENFNAVNNDLDGLRNLVLKTQEALKRRKRKEGILQLILSNSAKHNFQLYLNARNFDGKLDFDMKAKTLEIKVKPVNAPRDANPTETASMSGGEKSFSTVCFIMALWQEVELPFHFLDEFDVFMDGINRRIVMDLLISYAEAINQQFVFLTPLDMSAISVSDIVTVHRLEAPRQ